LRAGALRVPVLLALLPLLVAAGASPPSFERSEARARCDSHEPLRRPFFGDLHVHTRYSLDASTQGTRTRPRDAYRFARGEALGLAPFAADGSPGRRVQLRRPLDFTAVTDHAELFGEVSICNTGGALGYHSHVCRIYRGWPRLAFFFMNTRGASRFGFCGPDGRHCIEAGAGPWREMQEAAEESYDRSSSCRFTSFVGYEWTKVVNQSENLHRNVIFRNAKVPELPASAIEAPTPRQLWDALDAGCRDAAPGCEAVVIPHNSNLSGGNMFRTTMLEDGSPFTATYARRRAAFEPLVEIMQHKGDSECRQGVSTEDELCGFEALPYDSFLGRFASYARRPATARSFTRTAQGEGLVQLTRLGVNPFAFGVIASTDTHLGTPGLALEDDYPGHGGAGIPIGETLPAGLLDPIEYNPGGLAVLWAEENSRDALFAAMRRREAYGTSGPRIVVRLFGGFDYPEDLCGAADFAARGYAKGVPMGGDLPPPPHSGAAPTLAVWALRDAGPPGRPGAPLQRLQIIKLHVQDGGSMSRTVRRGSVSSTSPEETTARASTPRPARRSARAPTSSVRCGATPTSTRMPRRSTTPASSRIQRVVGARGSATPPAWTATTRAA
jgi:hypothetical protein